MNTYIISGPHVKKTFRDLEALIAALGDTETKPRLNIFVTTGHAVIQKFIEQVAPDSLVSNVEPGEWRDSMPSVRRAKLAAEKAPAKVASEKKSHETTSRECDQCGSIFEMKRKDSRFCCKICSDNWWKAKAKK